ncbi:hypothetical protein HBE96_23360 [Clostridium sp. P21]|uniref:Uncharacterized protein n=1 Tax=Clostridium muellerianum TaxID=2716538 RepID=A0A7Y0HPW9_9CLOT|nr:hypothetical protein [Clostridium muellerianum]NMM65519.1 hypothetical protein [Clostridium muellerianum]
MILVRNNHFTTLQNHNLTIIKIMVLVKTLAIQGFQQINNHNTIWFYFFINKRKKLYSVITNGYENISRYSCNSQFSSILLAKEVQLTVLKMVTKKLEMVAYTNQRRK